ncbi:hypothetical protein [Stutzerimonas degradans]|nr:hypothetical protein [Stutzerimonas degradans]MBV2204528.1 hypothetical protein [Pseudomonas sp.]
MDDYKHKQKTNKKFSAYLYIGKHAVPRRVVLAQPAATRFAPKLSTG